MKAAVPDGYTAFLRTDIHQDVKEILTKRLPEIKVDLVSVRYGSQAEKPESAVEGYGWNER
jgi:hypothetical protein